MTRNREVTLQETPIAEISEDRRSRRRYPISLPLEYKIMKNYRVTGSGTGTTLDLSSHGIFFATAESIPVGSFVELSVSWPVLLNECCPLQLVAEGRVVRSDAGGTAIRLDRHEFRTQGIKAFQRGAGRQTEAVGLHYRG